MKWLKISCLCLVLITVPVITESCCGLMGCGCGVKVEDYDIDDIALMVTPYPAVYPYPAVTGPSRTLQSIAFVIKIEPIYVSGLMGGPTGFAAVACDPAPPDSKQTISSILITSNENFTTTSTTVTAGSSLNQFFSVKLYNSTYVSLESLIGHSQLDEPFSIWCEKELNKPQTHEFTITITLDDGRVFALVSDRLDLAQG